MATARLLSPESVDGGTTYQVEACPFGDPPFTGPDDRDWDKFVTSPDKEACFEWRTGADRVRAAAENVAAGVWTLERALKEEQVAQWLASRAGDYCDAHGDEEAELAELPDAKFKTRMLLDAGRGLDNGLGLYAFYAEDDDSYLRDAVDCLDLPPWASVALDDEGGPGSGYTAAFLVLKNGHSLEDLEAWFGALAATNRTS